METMPNDKPLVCSLNAFNAAEMDRYRLLVRMLHERVQSVTETADGCTLTLPAERAVCQDAMEWATMERRCCSFLTIRLELAPQNGPLTLTLSGPEGTKDVLADALERLRVAPLLGETVERRL